MNEGLLAHCGIQPPIAVPPLASSRRRPTSVEQTPSSAAFCRSNSTSGHRSQNANRILEAHRDFMAGLIEVPISTVTSLSAERAVLVTRAILRSECGYAKLSPTALTISSRLTVADGGV